MRAKQWQQGFLIGFLVVVALWLASLISGLFVKARIAVTEARDLERQHTELKARKETLETDLAVLHTPRGKEAAIRAAFGVARPGEEVIVVVPPERPATTSVPTFWERVTGWFGR